MNKCKRSTKQEYKCTVCKTAFFSGDKAICIDVCLAFEVLLLWDLGIETTGCCCGKHVDAFENSSYIGVKEKHIELMKLIGYKVRINKHDKNREDSFIPKSI